MFPAAAAAGSTVAVTLDSLSLVCPHWAGLLRSLHDPGLLTQIYTQILMLCSSAGEEEGACRSLQPAGGEWTGLCDPPVQTDTRTLSHPATGRD